MNYVDLVATFVQGKKSILVEMGHTQSKVIVVEVGENEVKKIAVAHDSSLGGFHFDIRLFEHFSGICEGKHNCKVVWIVITQ